MRQRLAKGGEIARCALRELFPQAIWLDPDDSGRFLWAVYAVDDEVLRSALFDDRAYRYSSADAFQPVLEKSVCVVAGARNGIRAPVLDVTAHARGRSGRRV